MKREKITVFFAVDDNYIDFLLITLTSIIDNAKDENYCYQFYVMHNGLCKESKKKLKNLSSHRFKVLFFNVSGHINSLESRFKVRDYYTLTTYYRLLIPDAFFYIDKALYLDCDIVVLDDLSKLYKQDIGQNLVGAIPDASVQIVPEFIEYVETALKIERSKYFNAGILVMNLKKMRQTHLLRKVFEISKNVVFKIAQDQDLLNVICKDKTYYIDGVWNVMPIGEKISNPSLIHYNLIYKPWKRDDVLYQEHFWRYAGKLNIDDKIMENLKNIPQEYFINEEKGMANLRSACLIEASHPEWYNIESDIELDQKNYNISLERSEILEKIQQLEKEGKFDQDVENDPPYTPLQVGSVDYEHKKFSTKIKSKLFTYYSFKYFNSKIKNGSIIIDTYVGVENLKNLKEGAIITANHFNPFDSIPIHKAVKKYHYRHRLFKIIREGNYTFPGLYGKFMRYCNTLPLAHDYDVMRQMMKSVDFWLNKGYCILVYPEQSMWWNYLKPKPTKPGAFHFAAKANKPIVPTFITMRDTNKLDKDGDFIKAYTLHISEPIYPKKELSVKENAKYLQSENDRVWKEIYERTYHIPLTYTTQK